MNDGLTTEQAVAKLWRDSIREAIQAGNKDLALAYVDSWFDFVNGGNDELSK